MPHEHLHSLGGGRLTARALTFGLLFVTPFWLAVAVVVWWVAR